MYITDLGANSIDSGTAVEQGPQTARTGCRSRSSSDRCKAGDAQEARELSNIQNKAGGTSRKRPLGGEWTDTKVVSTQSTENWTELLTSDRRQSEEISTLAGPKSLGGKIKSLRR